MSRHIVLHLVSTAARAPYFGTLARLASPERFEIVVATLSPLGPLHDDLAAQGVRAFSLGATKRLHYAGAVLRLALLLRRLSVSIIQTHLVDASLVGLLAGRVAGVPVTVLTRHHADAVLLTGRRIPFWVDQLCSRWLASQIIAVSNRGSDVLQRYEGVSPKKIAVVHLGFDFQRLQAAVGSRETIRAEFRLGNETALCSVGRLDALKGYPFLIHAVANLIDSYPTLRVLIVGDGPERSRLEELRDSLGLGKHVIFTGFRNDVLNIISAADIVVQPSLSESFNQVLIEASALGRPVITTNTGDAAAVIQGGETGTIIPSGDTQLLIEAIRAMLGCPEKWEEMGVRGREFVQRYSAEGMVRSYEALYTKWLSEA